MAKKTEVSEDKQEPVVDKPVTKAPEYSEAQLYKQAQLKALAEKKDAKRVEVIAKLKELEASYMLEIRGRWIPYVEKNGSESSAFVLAERFQENEGEMKLILTLLVFSPTTATPYRAELTY